MPGPVRTGTTPPARPPASSALGRVSAALLALALAVVPAAARPDPTFAFEKRKDDLAGVVWSGSLRAGASESAGNTQSAGFTAEGTLARTTPTQRLLLNGNAAYARSRVTIPVESDGLPGIGPGELHDETQTTKRSWSARARWDRFLSARSSAYLLAGASSDELAGKPLVLGGQIGYGIDAVQTKHHTVRLELGYDFSREDHVAPSPGLHIHSARAFAGYAGRVLDPVTFETSVEVLTNIAPEQADRRLRPFEDTRVNAKASLKVKLNHTLSTGFQLGAAYDAAPAPRPPPPGMSWAAGYAPLAEKLDTTGEFFVMARF
jgi:hypothetical protein